MAIGVILAGGIGQRFGGEIPKQMIMLGDKPVLLHSVEKFLEVGEIELVVVVVHRSMVEEVEEMLSKLGRVRVIVGGEQRTDSTFNALRFVGEILGNNENPKVLVHDAARPYVEKVDIEKCLEQLENYQAVTLARVMTDTILELEKGNLTIKSIPNRCNYMTVQTPQGFRFLTLYTAHKNGRKDSNFEATDDCGVVMRYLENQDVRVVEGSVGNIKITFAQDITG